MAPTPTVAEAQASAPPRPKGRGLFSRTLGWRDPPSDLELVQAAYVLRHGERTPVRRRLTTADPPIPSTWNLCHVSRDFERSVLHMVGSDHLPTMTQIQRRIEVAGQPGEGPEIGRQGDCLLGELTDRGRISMLRLGQALRKRYIDDEHLLPHQFEERDQAKLYLRSTAMGRTIQSLDQVIAGLLGPQIRTFVPHEYIRNPLDEDMLPNPRTCPRLHKLMQKFAAEAARLYNPQLASYDQFVAPSDCGHVPRVNASPAVSGLIDTIWAMQAHDLPIPTAFQHSPLLRLMERAVLHEWFGGYRAPDPDERRQYRRLALGPFVERLYRPMERRAMRGEAEPLRLSVFLGHDATLVGLCHILDVFNDRWPAFHAGVALELFHDRQETAPVTEQHWPGYFVRCRYGDEELQLPGCRAAGQHYPGRPELCTLDAFRAVVIDRLQHPDQLTFQDECTMI
ncbi:acid phosphatase [Malassezia equina]|uniref:Acid phosphatase n=1 Tax=Malassezia equina TaxID=1381935 RepID=A0AAF0EA85_9BASI|nr:acid phosphatase [Malassezia equina]